MPNYAFVDVNAVILIEEGGSYLLFFKDKGRADGLLNATDKGPVLHLKDSLRSIVVGDNTRQRTANDRTSSARNKKILTAYAGNLQSKRSDPTLVREALGGGTFGKDLNTYNKNETYIQATGAGGSLRLDPGVAYEIDCN
jgi:hypothetical protein